MTVILFETRDGRTVPRGARQDVRVLPHPDEAELYRRRCAAERRFDRASHLHWKATLRLGAALGGSWSERSYRIRSARVNRTQRLFISTHGDLMEAERAWARASMR